MREINQKGVSPVIATVLLVGIVVVMGLIIFVWLRGLTEESVVKFDKNAELVCGEIQFEASYSSGTLSISNIGNVPIYQIMIKILKEGSFETKSLSDLSREWPETGLNQGLGFSGTITFNDTESIILIPVILGSSGGEEKSFTCEETRYGYEISL